MTSRIPIAVNAASSLNTKTGVGEYTLDLMKGYQQARRFTWDKAARQTLEMYHRLLS